MLTTSVSRHLPHQIIAIIGNFNSVLLPSTSSWTEALYQVPLQIRTQKLCSEPRSIEKKIGLILFSPQAWLKHLGRIASRSDCMTSHIKCTTSIESLGKRNMLYRLNLAHEQKSLKIVSNKGGKFVVHYEVLCS